MLLSLLLTSCLYDRERFLELSRGFVDDDGDGFREIDGDCNDANADVNPAAKEVCDGLDNDCLNGTDGPDTADILAWYQDLDADGYGSNAVSKLSCDPPYLFVDHGGDCDDASPEAYPGAVETCGSGVDSNCDGLVRDDADQDGYNCDDCDDANAAIFPGAEERCNEKDDDCNGLIDDKPVAPPTWYNDADGDGYGNPGESRAECGAPAGYVSNPDDCNDATADAAPGLPEVCHDGLDTNCDGLPGSCETAGEIVPIATINGLSVGSYLGQAVTPLGDINNDGFDDLAVAADGATISVYTIGGPFSGNIPVNVVSGMQLAGGSYLGGSLANVDDQNGDGWPDVAISGWEDPGAGDTYLVSSNNFGRTQLENAYFAHIGHTEAGALSGAGLFGGFDLQGDGMTDLASIAPWGSVPEISIFNGPLSGEYDFRQDAVVRFIGDQNMEAFGAGLILEDLDGNGLMDVVVGSLSHVRSGHTTGNVSLFRDVTPGILYESDSDAEWWGDQDAQVGSDIARTNDLDGDGYTDLWVGSDDSWAGTGTGTIRRISIHTPSGSIENQSSVTILSYGAGFRLLATDLNQDGNDDLAFSDYEWVDQHYSAVFMFYGPFAGTMDTSAADAWYFGEGYPSLDLALAGDTDGDGNLEVVTGNPLANDSTGNIVLLEIDVW